MAPERETAFEADVAKMRRHLEQAHAELLTTIALDDGWDAAAALLRRAADEAALDNLASQVMLARRWRRWRRDQRRSEAADAPTR